MIEIQGYYRKKVMDKMRIRCYVSSEGKDCVCNWYASVDEDVQAAFQIILTACQDLQFNQWPETLFKKLKDRPGSKCRGLGEIILNDIDANKYCFRILGFNGPGETDFTMLYVFNKSIFRRYKKPCQIAQGFKKDVELDWNHSVTCECAPPD